MNAISKLIQEVSFPRAGEYFSMVCTGWQDNSYKTDVFQCLASDAARVVCKRITPGFGRDKPMVFYREDWRFDDVSSLLEALGIPEQESEAD